MRRTLRAGRYPGISAACSRSSVRRRAGDRISLRSMWPHTTAAIAILLALSACDKPVVVNTVSDTFCTRVERFHATQAETDALKANSGPLERFIRWAAGINKQWDDECLKPAKGA